MTATADHCVPPEGSTPLSRTLPALAVVIPARNEEKRLPRCLQAVLRADDLMHAHLKAAPATRIVVVLDNCTDQSRAVVDRWPQVEVLIRQFGNVGAARAAGVDHVLSTEVTADHPDWIACTDADSAVPVDWLLHQMDHARAGTDLLLGLVRPDGTEMLPNLMDRWLSRYQRVDGHPHIHGANMGIRVGMYQKAGGFPLIAEHEDVALTHRIRSAGGRVVSTSHSAVLTSARTKGRTPGGMAGYLEMLAQ